MSNYTKWQENERAEFGVQRAEFGVQRAEISGIAFLRIPAILVIGFYVLRAWCYVAFAVGSCHSRMHPLASPAAIEAQTPRRAVFFP